MFSSLPDYRRFAEAALQRIRKDHKRKSSHRLDRMLFNILLLMGLWGLPLYARWVVVPDIHRTKNELPSAEPPSLIGKWQAANGSHFSITFTADGQFVVSWKDTVLETARYLHLGEEIVLADFREQPGDRPLAEEKKCWLRISFAGKKLSTNRNWLLDNDERKNDDWRRKNHWHGSWEIEGEHLKLQSAVFERVE